MAKVSAVPSYLFILESINDAVIVIALNGKILFCNTAAQHLLGYTREEMIGQDIDIFIPKNKAHEREKLVEHVLWGERVENFETQRLHKDKHLIDVSISLSPLKDEEGKTIGTTAVVRHIGAKRRAEGKFQAILESAPDAMVVVNKFGQIILINSQTEKLFGYKPEQIVGQEIEILIPDRKREQHPFHREAFFKDPKAKEMGAGIQLSGKKSNGTEFPAEITLSPLETEGGILVCAAIRDITERKKAEEILRQSEEKFTKAFELSPAGIIMSKVTSGEIVAVNDRLLDIVGFERDEVIGHSTVELNLISREVRLKIMHELERSGFMDNQEIAFRRKTGEYGVALFSMLLITLNGEKVAFSMYYDITERKKAEAALKQKSEELERSNKELEQFAYVISHDLQAPLRSISSYIGLVEKKLNGTLEGQIKEMFDVVVRASTGMKAMIEDLLNYSRIGKNERKEDPVDLNNILAEIRADLDYDVKQSNAMIIASPMPVIKGNSTELKQLFENMLSNAIKFRKKDVRPEVSIHCKNKPLEWEFSVCDNGIGISQEYFQKLFLVFQRLHHAGDYPGTGIGLATCKKIVDLLGGKIWLTSKEGIGTTFYFTIPKQITAPRLEANGQLGNNDHHRTDQPPSQNE